MADMTPLTDILNGDDADATDVQNNFQTIETYINGVDLIRSDGTEVMAASLDMDSNKIVNLADATASGDAIHAGQFAVGAWTTHTPTVTQGGAVTKTVNYSKYVRNGRMITWNFTIVVTSAGTAANALTLTLPVDAVHISSVCGTGTLYDANTTTRYTGVWQCDSVSAVSFGIAQASPSAWGVVPNLAIANTDSFSGSITYEAAS